ncbi:uncharacterized protein [Macrobrachium rosenbergii]
MGLQYRKKRLKKLDVQGRKETFLEKEHHSTCVLQQLTDLEVDRRLLAKASSLMKESKEEEEGDDAESRSKSKRKDRGQDGSEESTEQTPKKKQKRGDKNLSKKNAKKQVTENRNTSLESETDRTGSLESKGDNEMESNLEEKESVTLDEANLHNSSRGIKRKMKMPENVSEDEGISGDNSSSEEEEEEQSTGGGFTKEEIEKPDHGEGSDSEESSAGEDDGSDEDDVSGEEDMACKSSSDEEEDEDDDDDDFDEDASSNDGSEGSEESDADVSENESEGGELLSKKCEVRTDKGGQVSLFAKKKEKSENKTKSVNLSGKFAQGKKLKGKKLKQTVTDDEGSEVSDVEGSVDFDSEGSVVDENYVGEEVTSIWDEFKVKGKGKKASKSSNPLLDTKDKFSDGGIIKSKGTVEIRRLNLTDQKSVVELLETNKGEASSASEDEDFFVRGPVTKKRKKSMKSVDDEIDGEANNNEDNNEGGEAGDSDGAVESDSDAREHYIDNNFKKIWGKGMEETIKVARGRRGMSGRGRGGGGGGGWGRDFDGQSWGRGGFEGSRGRGFGGGRGRAFGRDNPNFLPVGSKLPMDQGFGANKSNGESQMSFNSRPGNRFKQFSDDERFETGNRGHSRDRFARGGRGRGRGRGRDENGRPGERFETGNRGHSHDRFAWGGRGRGRDERGRPGARRGRFESERSRNPNLAPVTGSRDDKFSPGQRGASHSSLLHPSWLAKQKEKEMASSIYTFKGQVKKFDLDD